MTLTGNLAQSATVDGKKSACTRMYYSTIICRVLVYFWFMKESYPELPKALNQGIYGAALTSPPLPPPMVEGLGFKV